MTFEEEKTSNDNFEAMEEAKLIRMATAISEYTISSMLRETASEAAEILNKAAPTARTFLCAIGVHSINKCKTPNPYNSHCEKK